MKSAEKADIMASCKIVSHKWEYAAGGMRTCKRCESRERFNTMNGAWNSY